MYSADNAREPVERDPRNDPRGRPSEGEAEVERKPIVADRAGDGTAWPAVPMERRRTERRRIERMGTDI